MKWRWLLADGKDELGTELTLCPAEDTGNSKAKSLWLKPWLPRETVSDAMRWRETKRAR